MTVPSVARSATGKARLRNLPEIDMQRACEQQERQHPVHDDRTEVDLEQSRGQWREEMLLGKSHVDEDQNERRHDAHEQQADGVRQRKEFVIEPTEQRRQRQENGGQIQK